MRYSLDAVFLEEYDKLSDQATDEAIRHCPAGTERPDVVRVAAELSIFTASMLANQTGTTPRRCAGFDGRAFASWFSC